MGIPFGHHELHNRYIFEGVLEIITPVRISSGIASVETDAPFIADYSGTPYIPGSSLRGALRAEIERLVSALDKTKAGLSACISFEKDSCAEKVKKFQKQLDESPDEERDADTMDQHLAEFLEQELCDLCRLFGTAGYASRIFFEDCKLREQSPINKVIRDGVGIDRDTGAARDGAKFNYEVIEKGSFSFKMTVENLDKSGADLKLVNLVLALLGKGLFVGGKRSSGLGKIRLASYEVSGFEEPGVLWEKILAGRDPYGDIEWDKEEKDAEAQTM